MDETRTRRVAHSDRQEPRRGRWTCGRNPRPFPGRVRRGREREGYPGTRPTRAGPGVGDTEGWSATSARDRAGTGTRGCHLTRVSPRRPSRPRVVRRAPVGTTCVRGPEEVFPSLPVLLVHSGTGVPGEPV